MDYVLNLLAVLSVITPCYILSIVMARKKKPIIGMALALSKVFLTYRAGIILEWMLKSSGKIGWEHFGLQYSPVGAVILMVMIAAGGVCTVLNMYVFCKKCRQVAAIAQA